MVLFAFNVGPIKVDIPLPWKKSIKHLYANFAGTYNFLQRNLSHVSDLHDVASLIRRKINDLDPASLHRIEDKMADEPRFYGPIVHLLKSQSLPILQRILVKSSAKPPVIEHRYVDEAMKMAEGSVRKSRGYRFLEWPFQILNALNIQRFDQKVKLRDSDGSESSDTDENGSDSSDDEEQGADANILLAREIPQGK